MPKGSRKKGKCKHMNDVFRPNIIHILGASGSGTSTLGQALSRLYGYTQLDTDDYFWMPTDPKFTVKREIAERQKLMEADIINYQRCVITGSLCGWGDIFIPRFDLVIYIITSKDVRLSRLKKREYERFGDRILPGGDMYTDHVKFLAWAGQYDIGGPEMRSRVMHDAWLKQMACPVIIVDGAKPIEVILKDLGLFDAANE